MNPSAHPHTLVAGIGNVFLGDDGFGCAVARELLAKTDIPCGTRVIDYGIRGLDLAYALLDPYKRVIFVDVISRGATPGTIYLLQPVAADTNKDTSLDPHSMDPAHVLAMANSLGEIHAEIFIVGCEPFDFGDELEGRMELSDVVAASVPQAARAVLDLVQKHAHTEGTETAEAPCSVLRSA